MGRVIYSYDVEEPIIEFKGNKKNYTEYETEEPGVYINRSAIQEDDKERLKVTAKRSMDTVLYNPITYIVSRYNKYGPDLFSLMTEEEVETYRKICENQAHKNQDIDQIQSVHLR